MFIGLHAILPRCASFIEVCTDIYHLVIMMPQFHFSRFSILKITVTHDIKLVQRNCVKNYKRLLGTGSFYLFCPSLSLIRANVSTYLCIHLYLVLAVQFKVLKVLKVRNICATQWSLRKKQQRATSQALRQRNMKIRTIYILST